VSCSSKDYLTDKGVVDVSPDDVVTYCQAGGCGEHTLAVIKCIHEVKRDFWFANKLKIMDLNDIITNGCRDSKGTISYCSVFIYLLFFLLCYMTLWWNNLEVRSYTWVLKLQLFLQKIISLKNSAVKAYMSFYFQYGLRSS
jgi:hypothetical protein